MKHIPSPCISVCQYNTKEYCVGCKRSKKEIIDWIDLPNEEKEKILKELKSRNIHDTDYYGHFA